MLLLKDAVLEYELECRVRRLAQGMSMSKDMLISSLLDILLTEVL